MLSIASASTAKTVSRTLSNTEDRSSSARDILLKEFDALHRGTLHTASEGGQYVEQESSSQGGADTGRSIYDDDEWEGEEEHGQQPQVKHKRSDSAFEKFWGYVRWGGGGGR
jgi:hypothetical protein